MPKRRADADSRRFFDEFEHVRVSRFRATGVIDPKRFEALIPFPGGRIKLIATKHVAFRRGGGWSYFVCPKCAGRRRNLYLVEDAPLCRKCCDKLNIRHRAVYGFGGDARRRASDKALDQRLAKLDTTEPLRFKPTPASWQGKAQFVYNSRSLTERAQRQLISLRLNQLASQQAKDGRGLAKAYKPLAATKQLIDPTPIWRARTAETLQRALDKAQVTILSALESDDPTRQLNAAKLMLRTKQARDRGL